jgi:hypothetical protein
VRSEEWCQGKACGQSSLLMSVELY